MHKLLSSIKTVIKSVKQPNYSKTSTRVGLDLSKAAERTLGSQGQFFEGVFTIQSKHFCN